jgi:hypothetical protein
MITGSVGGLGAIIEASAESIPYAHRTRPAGVLSATADRSCSTLIFTVAGAGGMI